MSLAIITNRYAQRTVLSTRPTIDKSHRLAYVGVTDVS